MVLYDMSTLGNMSNSYQQFANNTLAKEPFVVLVYANWCGHCQRFDPIWNDLITQSTVAGVQVEDDVFKHLTSTHPDNSLTKIIKSTQAYPTLYKVTPDLSATEYNGARDAESILAMLAEISGQELEPEPEPTLPRTKTSATAKHAKNKAASKTATKSRAASATKKSKRKK